MSGNKYSEYRLQQERQEKMNELQTITNLFDAVSGVSTLLASALDRASVGLKQTFASEVNQAQQWLDQDMPENNPYDMDSDIGQIRQLRSRLERLATSGKQAQKDLSVALTQKADQMGKQLSAEVADAEQFFAGHRNLLELWFDDPAMNQWQNQLSRAADLLQNEQYDVLQSHLKTLQTDLQAKHDHAQKQEDKHQKRLYLLKALRQVCVEMGFAEVTKPTFEDDANRGSKILYTVDTYNQGEISFKLTLDEVSCLSQIAEGKCFEEFSQLSSHLDDMYGIQTSFKMMDGSPIPHLIRKGEKDRPDDSGKTMNA